MCSVLGKPHLSNFQASRSIHWMHFGICVTTCSSYCSEFLGGTNDTFLRRIEDARVRSASKPNLPDSNVIPYRLLIDVHVYLSTPEAA